MADNSTLPLFFYKKTVFIACHVQIPLNKICENKRFAVKKIGPQNERLFFTSNRLFSPVSLMEFSREINKQNSSWQVAVNGVFALVN